MELGLQFEDIFCYEASPKVVSTHEESLETAIPEYCPDIARIVDTTGHLSIRERQLAEGRCTVSGSVKVTVLYTSEEAAGLRSLSVSVPFSYVLDERSLAGCGTICAQGRVLLAEARAVTSRKLYIKVIPEITITGYRAVKRRIACGTQEESSLRKRCRQIEVDILAAISEKGFSFTDDLMLESGCVPEDILLHRMCPVILSAQRLGNKLMVKGEMHLYALYRDDGQILRQYDAALPFSQILDVAELPENAEYALSPQVDECDIRVTRTDTGIGFGLNARVSVCLMAYQHRTITYLEDLYSTCFDTTLERQDIIIPLAKPDSSVQREALIQLEFDRGEPFISVTSIDCAPAEVFPEEGQVTLRAALHVRLLYLDESGAPVSTERTVECSVTVPEVNGPVSACCCRAVLQFTGGACRVVLPVTFLIGKTGETSVSGITAVTMTEPDSDIAARPSLILCRLGKGETLWDIAKRYHTDEDAIRGANQLAQDADAGQYMLLIPKTR